jgi:uncharacterized protein HemX
MIADAEYLLSVANQKLHLVGDVRAVLAAMEAADQRLHDSGDPAVFRVREALASEIDVLKKFHAPDVVGISAKLLTMEKKVRELPLFLPHGDAAKARADKSPKTEAEAEDSEETGPLGSAFKDFKDLVTVRRTDRPITAVLTPEEAEGIRQILLLKLETTRSALLRSDDDLFKASLNSALEWLEANFDTAAELTQELEAGLKELQGETLRVPFPDVGNSLNLLRNIEKLRLEADESAGKGSGKSPKSQPGPADSSPPSTVGPLPNAGPEPGAQP